MPTQVLMPALSPTMEKGNLAKWLKKEGDTVKSGDVIAEIETDKATMEVEAVDEGTLGKILVPEGTNDVAVNTPIAMILADGEDAAALKNGKTAQAADDRPARQEKAAESAPPAASKPPKRSRPPGEDRDRRSACGAAAPEPEVPEGTELVTMTMREALRDAMAEEMRRDPDVFVMGEEVAEYQGAYKVTQGLLEEFGARRVIDTPITEHGFAGLGVGAALAGLEADRRVHDLQFRHAGDGPAHQFGGQDALHVRRPDALSIVFRGPNGPAARVAAQHSQDYSSWYSHIPGPEGHRASTAADAKGLLKAAIRDPNPVMFLENEILYGHSSPVPKLDDYVLPIGRARVVRSGTDVTHGRLVDGHDLRAQGRRRIGEREHLRGGHRSAHAQADGLRHHRRVGEEDRPPRHRRRRLEAVRRRRRNCRPRDGRGVRLSRRRSR